MNYELLSKLAMEESERYKNEILILKKRNEILHIELETLRVKSKKLEEEKNLLEKEIETLKSALEFKEEKEKNENFTFYS